MVAMSLKMTQEQMRGYEQVGTHHGFSIMILQVDRQTSYYVSVRIGTLEKDDFILRLPAVTYTLNKMGFFNRLYDVIEEAKQGIDKNFL